MTEIYLHFLVSHYGLYANAPVIFWLQPGYENCGPAYDREVALEAALAEATTQSAIAAALEAASGGR